MHGTSRVSPVARAAAAREAGVGHLGQAHDVASRSHGCDATNASVRQGVAMSDSLIDEAVSCCRNVIDELEDGPLRRVLNLRLGLLENAAWSIALEPAAQAEVVGLVRMLLDLRDDVVRARRASRSLTAAAP